MKKIAVIILLSLFNMVLWYFIIEYQKLKFPTNQYADILGGAAVGFIAFELIIIGTTTLMFKYYND